MAVAGEARRLDGRATARQIHAEVAEQTARLNTEAGVVPSLRVLLVGDDPASQVYVRNKERAAAKAGMRSEVLPLPADCTAEAIYTILDALNKDDSVHGILVQLPLPGRLNAQRVTEAVDPEKDVDGLHPVNAGRLLIGMPGFVPCTPAGIVELLRRNDIELKGRHAVVIGRSNIVGKPMAVLLLREHCTVTICHSRTPDLAAVAADADILVAAVGKPGLVTAEFIKPGAVVVDVGIHSVSDEPTVRGLFGDDPARLETLRKKGSTLVGDVHPLQARSRAAWLTPVPGGVGPLTIAMLLHNTLRAARRAAGLEADD